MRFLISTSERSEIRCQKMHPTVLRFHLACPLKVLVLRNAFEAFIVYTGHLRIEILQQRFHCPVENPEYLFGFICHAISSSKKIISQVSLFPSFSIKLS